MIRKLKRWVPAIAIPALVAAAGTGLGFLGGDAVAAGAFHGDFNVHSGVEYVEVNVAPQHGQLTHFAVGYAYDTYVHEDIVPASQHVAEITSYTGHNAPADGCVVPSRGGIDLLTQADVEDNGLVPQSQPWTPVHHTLDFVTSPKGSGPYLSWCHQEHGPETWAKLTFQDGSTVEVYWEQPTNVKEILISHTAVHTSAFGVVPDGD